MSPWEAPERSTAKRHPTLGDNVMIGSGAKVLGPFRVGDNARVAAGAVVLDAVPDNATAVGVPARVVKVNGVRTCDLDQVHVSDPVSQELCRLNFECERLRKQVELLTAKLEEQTGAKLEAPKEPIPQIPQHPTFQKICKLHHLRLANGGKLPKPHHETETQEKPDHENL